MTLAEHLEELAEPFEERAAIIEYCGGININREEAEEAARAEVERFRNACEVRTVAGLESDAARAEFLADVAKKRGNEAAQRLRRDVWQYMTKGSL